MVQQDEARLEKQIAVISAPPAPPSPPRRPARPRWRARCDPSCAARPRADLAPGRGALHGGDNSLPFSPRESSKSVWNGPPVATGVLCLVPQSAKPGRVRTAMEAAIDRACSHAACSGLVLGRDGDFATDRLCNYQGAIIGRSNLRLRVDAPDNGSSVALV